MSDYDDKNLHLILYRLSEIEKKIDTLISANSDVWKILSKVRVDEERLGQVVQSLDKVDQKISAIGTNHDKRFDELDGIVKPNYQDWSRTAKNQNRFMLAICGLFLAAVGGLLGLR